MGEIDQSLIEMARPLMVLNGLRMEMNVYLNHTESIDKNIEGVLKKHIDSGDIAAILKDAWNLVEMPIVSKLNVQRIESKLRKEGTVNLSSARSQSGSGIQMEMTVTTTGNSAIDLRITPIDKQFPRIDDAASPQTQDT